MARTMHQTTVRFGSDLWQELVQEADRVGVSVAQYVREAAVARLARSGAHTDPGEPARPQRRRQEPSQSSHRRSLRS